MPIVQICTPPQIYFCAPPFQGVAYFNVSLRVHRVSFWRPSAKSTIFALQLLRWVFRGTLGDISDGFGHFWLFWRQLGFCEMDQMELFIFDVNVRMLDLTKFVLKCEYVMRLKNTTITKYCHGLFFLGGPLYVTLVLMFG